MHLTFPEKTQGYDLFPALSGAGWTSCPEKTQPHDLFPALPGESRTSCSEQTPGYDLLPALSWRNFRQVAQSGLRGTMCFHPLFANSHKGDYENEGRIP